MLSKEKGTKSFYSPTLWLVDSQWSVEGNNCGQVSPQTTLKGLISISYSLIEPLNAICSLFFPFKISIKQLQNAVVGWRAVIENVEKK